jgi:hypothetical protein
MTAFSPGAWIPLPVEGPNWTGKCYGDEVAKIADLDLGQGQGKMKSEQEQPFPGSGWGGKLWLCLLWLWVECLKHRSPPADWGKRPSTGGSFQCRKVELTLGWAVDWQRPVSTFWR